MRKSFLSALSLGASALALPQMARTADDPEIIVNAEAMSKWKEVESDHFKIIGMGDEKSLAKVSARLEAVHYVLKVATGIQEPKDAKVVKVKVYVVGDVSDVQRLLGDPSVPAAGYYDPQLAGPISVIPRDSGGSGAFSAQVILFHEYTHHFMLQYAAAAYPAWYVEGFAEIASTSSFERAGTITFGKAAKHRENEFRYLKHFPAAKLVDGSFQKDDRNSENHWNYGDAWALSHYLTFSDKRKGQLRGYLAGINAGKSFAESAKVFGDLNALTREVEIYIEGGSFPYKAPPLPAEVMKAPTVRTLSVAEAEFIEPNITMERVNSISTKEDYDAYVKHQAKLKQPVKKDYATYLREETERHQKWMKALDVRVARLPKYAGGWVVKAHAECMARDFANCQTSADRALALQPDNWEAKLRKGQAMLGLAKAMPDAKRADAVKAARRIIISANRGNTAAHEPLLHYFDSFGIEGRSAPDDALDGLQQVVDTIPQIHSTRLKLGRAYIDRGLVAQARKVLRPLAYGPHESTEQASARELLEALDAKEAQKPAS